MPVPSPYCRPPGFARKQQKFGIDRAKFGDYRANVIDQSAIAPVDLVEDLSEVEGQILHALHRHGPLSRSQLADRTGVSRSVLNLRLKALTSQGLIHERGTGPSRGGRPPSLVSIREDAGYVVAIDLGATSLDVAIANLNVRLLIHKTEPADVSEGPLAVLARIETVIDALLEELGIDRSQLKGIGMGIPGPVEFETGESVSPPIMPGWHRFPIRRQLRDRFGCPVWVDNDVNVMAAGESWAGLGQDQANFVVIKLGSGIGCGIVCRGQVYRGADGSAGDIGHIAVTSEAVVCRCGSLGCLEAVAGGAALGRRLTVAAQQGEVPLLDRLQRTDGPLTAVDLGLLLQQGDPFANELVRETGAIVGGTLAGLVNFFNPSLIVIGGEVARLGDLLLASIREAIYRRSLPLSTRHLLVQRSELDGSCGVIGAAAMVVRELYQLAPARAWPDLNRARDRGRP